MVIRSSGWPARVSRSAGRSPLAHRVATDEIQLSPPSAMGMMFCASASRLLCRLRDPLSLAHFSQIYSDRSPLACATASTANRDFLPACGTQTCA